MVCLKKKYIEYNSANTYTNISIPIWVNKMHSMIIGGGGSGYSQYTNGGGGGQFTYSIINVVKTIPRLMTINVGQAGSSGGSNGGNSSVIYGGYSSIANGGICAGVHGGAGGSGSIGVGTTGYNGQTGIEGITPGFIDGGVNGFINAGLTHDSIEYQIFGKGGQGGNTNDEYSGYYSGNDGYVRIYFCLN